MRTVTGYHINNNMIAMSNNRTRAEGPWLEFLLDSNPDDIKIMAHLDCSVACLCKLINLTDDECRKLYNDGKLYIPPYTLRYIPGKFFSVKKGMDYNAPFINFCDADQYQAADLSESTETIAAKAAITGSEVYQALVSIGLNPTTLTSPIRAWEKEKMAALDLPTYKDMPDEAVEYAEQCVDGVWIEAFQKGSFPVSYDYDIVGAHPYFTSLLMDTRLGKWKYSRDYVENAYYGYMRGSVHITAPFSPIAFKNNGSQWTTTGRWDRYLTTKQTKFIERYNLGKFHMRDGWFWTPTEIKLPLHDTIQTLQIERERTDNSIKRSVIKRVMVGIWGKTLEQRQDGFKGDYYNPCWGVEVESQTRLKVSRFVLDNNLYPSLLSIAVDGVISSSSVDCANNGQLGSWIFNTKCPSIIVSSGLVAQKGKENDGDFVLRYDWLMDKINQEPEATEYTMESITPMTLGKAIATDSLASLGELTKAERTIHIGLETKRAYRQKPKCGRDLLGQYTSSPWDIGSVQGRPSEKVFHDI